MIALSWPSIAAYCAFSIFVFYQQLHVKNFRGESQKFALALNITAFVGMLTGIVYLIYYGWVVVWWAPFVIFFISLAVSFFAFSIERVISTQNISLLGFVGWPLCAYLMFYFVP